MQTERKQVVEYCRKLEQSQLSSGTSGNISVCNRQAGLLAISPSSMDYGRMRTEDVVVMEMTAMDMPGDTVTGERRPSS